LIFTVPDGTGTQQLVSGKIGNNDLPPDQLNTLAAQLTQSGSMQVVYNQKSGSGSDNGTSTATSDNVGDDAEPTHGEDGTPFVCRGGTCSAENFENGSGVTADSEGKLHGVSTQSKDGGTVIELSKPFKNGQVGVTTVGAIEAEGGEVVFDGTPGNPNHATVNGLTAEQLEKLFTPTIENPVPKEQRGR
jgi:hypothetical protein